MMRVLAITLASFLALTGCDDGSKTGGKHGIPPIPAQMGPGLYAVGDGTQIYSRTRLSQDGTYTDHTEAMEPVSGGAWRVTGDDTICFDPEGDGTDQRERCWQNGPPDANGSFISSRIDGSERYRVTPLEE